MSIKHSLVLGCFLITGLLVGLIMGFSLGGLIVYYYPPPSPCFSSYKSEDGFTNGVKLMDWAITHDAAGDKIVIVNGAGSTINITSITMTGLHDERHDESCGSTQFFLQDVGGNSIDAGEYKVFSMGAGTGCSGVLGNCYKIQVNITYSKRVNDTDQTYSSIGTISGTFEN